MKIAPAVLGCLGAALAVRAAVAAPAAIQCPAPGWPTGMHLAWVAPRMTVDGLPLAVLRFTSPLSAKGLQRWYWRRWRGFGQHPVLYRVAPWQVIARYRGGCFETIQFKARGLGSYGFVGLSEPGQAASANTSATDFPLPAGSHLLLTLASDDHGKRARTLIALIPYGVDAAFYYRHTLTELGWATQMDRRGNNGRDLIFQKGSTVADLSFTPFIGGTTGALIALVSH
jgi:hypothetical protein